MADNVIEVEGLGKKYRIGARQERYRTLRDHLAKGAKAAGRKVRSFAGGTSEERAERDLWALRDLSFTVRSGEVLGVIGRNGAGKTTLLKILSRITEPTTGVARIRGRVGSLLEVGTGFHPELTGRENVFLNGAILGMKRTEIQRKFDEIVAFAEVERFIDTQVKHYSSGMHVRLAFAVASHLDPDVLMIDEVLAVGDAGFQKKCIATIRDATGGGRTALVVSHNLGLLRSLCTKAVLLEEGRLIAEGEPAEVVTRYHGSFGNVEPVYRPRETEHGGPVRVIRALMRDAEGNIVTEIPCGAALRLELTVACAADARVDRPWIGVRIASLSGGLVSHVGNREAGFELPPLEKETVVTCELQAPNLMPGSYLLGFVVADINHKIYDRSDAALPLFVNTADVFGTGFPPSGQGSIFLRSRWSAGPARAGTGA